MKQNRLAEIWEMTNKYSKDQGIRKIVSNRIHYQFFILPCLALWEKDYPFFIALHHRNLNVTNDIKKKHYE